MRIVDYIVVSYDNRDGLVGNVKDKIAEGWQPLGGVSAIPETEAGNYFLFQAMVKYADTEATNAR